MAILAQKVPQNAPGRFYVDGQCIYCDLCVEIAPAIFKENKERGWAYVHRQPENEEEEAKACEALEACPTESIGDLTRERWLWRQSWLDLAFIHFRVAATELQRLLPPGLIVQEFDGSAWIGLVPFRMANIRHRRLPPLPVIPDFLELNLRTYVEADGRAGVWFLTLEANSRAAVFVGRTFYHLPYHYASIRHECAEGHHRFASSRPDGKAAFAARYKAVGSAFVPAAGTFENWFAERSCLYAEDAGHLKRVDVYHEPWQVQKAEIEIEASDVLAAAGLTPLDAAPVCHYSDGVHVVSFPKATSVVSSRD